MPTCLAVGCSKKCGKNDTNHYFKIPDPKKDSELCSHSLHIIGYVKWNRNDIINLDGTTVSLKLSAS